MFLSIFGAKWAGRMAFASCWVADRPAHLHAPLVIQFGFAAGRSRLAVWLLAAAVAP